MDQTNSIILLFLEEPASSLIITPTVERQMEFKNRTAPIHHSRILTVDEDLSFRLSEHPPSTRVLIDNPPMLAPNLVKWLGKMFQVVAIERRD